MNHSGNGKLILLGEHAVVYGHAAVAVALPHGLSITTTLGEVVTEPMITLHLSALDFMTQCSALPSALHSFSHHSLSHHSVTDPLSTAISRGLLTLYKAGMPVIDRSITLFARGPLPFKVGLGSSAALSVAILRSLAYNWWKQPLTESLLLDAAFEMECAFHGQPRGIDHCVAVKGGVQRFIKGTHQPILTPIKLKSPLHLVLSWVPRQGSTADAVKKVAIARQNDPNIDTVLHHLGALSEAGVHALETGQVSQLGALLYEAHRLLTKLGIITPSLDQLYQTFHASGAIGAKMTGAGLGGTVFGLYEDEIIAKRAKDMLMQSGVSAWQLCIAQSTDKTSTTT